MSKNELITNIARVISNIDGFYIVHNNTTGRSKWKTLYTKIDKSIKTQTLYEFFLTHYPNKAEHYSKYVASQCSIDDINIKLKNLITE